MHTLAYIQLDRIDEHFQLTVIAANRFITMNAPTLSGIRARAYRFGPSLRELIFAEIDAFRRNHAD